MTGRELRASRGVKYAEEPDSSQKLSSSRPPRETRVSAQEAARVLSSMDDDDLYESPAKPKQTRSHTSGSSRGKDNSVEDDEDTDDQTQSSSESEEEGEEYGAPKTRAKKARAAVEPRVVARAHGGRFTRGAARDGFEPEVFETLPPKEKKSRKCPKPRMDPVPKAPRPKVYVKPKRTANTFSDTPEDKKKRLDYLLKQSETFAHVMTVGGGEDKLKERRGRKKAGTEAGSSQQSIDHRHAARRGSSEDEELAEELTELADITRFEKTPFYIQGGQMRDYQVRGLNWLISLCENKINGILADEMGLGKTLQTISLLGYMYSVKKSDLPHLIIVPKSTLSNWQLEFRKWCPTLESALLKGDQEERKIFMKEAKEKRSWDVMVTSYEIALIEQSFIRKFYWGYVVIDEAHRIKNEASCLATAVRTFRSAHRLLLTGTPLQNSLHELWALLNFLLPDIFESAEDFDSWFGDTECQTDMSLVERLHSILRPFLLRRVKADVEKDLPPKTEIKLFVGLAPLQRTWYRNILLKDITVLNSLHGIGSSSLHNMLMHLRKCCNHPYLFEGAEAGPPYTTGRHLIDNCGKMILLDKLLQRLKEKGSRVLIFSQMTRVLDVLEDYCGMVGHEYCRLDGSTGHEERQEAIRDFNSPDSTKFLFLLSTRAGGLGINLTSADTVILYDSDWNPQVDLQAMDRVHRIGQTKPVTVFRLITENTVEERIIERAERKMRLDALVIQSGRLVDKTKGLGKDEIQQMIRFGAQSIIHSSDVDITNITELDIDTILAKGKEKTEELNKKFEALTEDKLKTFSNDYSNSKPIYEFEGEDYRGRGVLNAKLNEMEQNWISLPKRERKQLYDLSGASSSHVYGRSGRDSPPWQPEPKQPKQMKIVLPRPPVHKFIDIHFPPPKLLTLLDKELRSYRKLAGFKFTVSSDMSEEEKTRLQAAQDAIKAAEPLTAEEEVEKHGLLKQTFSSWRRTDISAMLRGIEQYGPNDVEKIWTFVRDTKTLDEVRRYLPVFLERYVTLTDAPKIKARIQRGLLNQDKQKRRREAIKMKMAETGYPQMDMKIPYPSGHKAHGPSGLSNSSNNGARMNWLEEEDRYLLCAYGVACEEFPDDNDEMMVSIRNSMQSSPQFKFDYLIRSITTEKVKERIDALLNWIVREMFPAPVVPKAPVIIKSGNAQNREEPVQPPKPKQPHQPMQSKTFQLKYVDTQGGNFALVTPHQPSTSSATPSAPRVAVSPISRPSIPAVSPQKSPPVHAPKVLALSPGGSKGSPIVTAKPSAATSKRPSPPAPTATGKKIPIWAMVADAKASAAVKPLQLKRKQPNDPDSDDDIVEVYASVKRTPTAGTKTVSK